MQFDDAPAACGMVQSVDVLRDDAMHCAAPLELGERDVAAVRLRARNARPARRAARPVAPAGSFAPYEFLILNRSSHALRGCWAAVVRYAGLRAAAGAGENGDLPAAEQLSYWFNHHSSER